MIVMIILALSSVFYLRANDNRTKLEIYRDNQLQGSYDLGKDQLILLADGITVEINNGRVRMKESICSNQICVKQGYSKKIPIICAPEKIALIIKRQKEIDIMITR